MTAISDFADAFRQHNDTLHEGLDNISNDLAELQRKLDEIQNSPGNITPEDQARLDEALMMASNLATRVKEIDDMSPPAVPDEPAPDGTINTGLNVNPGVQSNTNPAQPQGQKK